MLVLIFPPFIFNYKKLWRKLCYLLIQIHLAHIFDASEIKNYIGQAGESTWNCA